MKRRRVVVMVFREEWFDLVLLEIMEVLVIFFVIFFGIVLWYMLWMCLVVDLVNMFLRNSYKVITCLSWIVLWGWGSDFFGKGFDL